MSEQLIEYRVGSESHSSAWGKFYVKGLETWEVKEGGERDRHNSYTDLAARVPEGTVFTVFSQAGNKRGTDTFDFYICQVVSDETTTTISGGCYGKGGTCCGSFTILCRGEGKTKAPRLMEWWGKMGEKCQDFRTEDGKLQKGTKEKYAQWCRKHLDMRGLKDLPAMSVEFQGASHEQ